MWLLLFRQRPVESERPQLPTTHDRRIDNELSNEKIDNIERKLKAIENHIIEDTIKYTGANDGMLTKYHNLKKATQ